jgi:serine/threonine protein kinase
MEELLRMHGLTSPPPGSESGYQRPPEIRLHIQMKLCTTSLRDWLERPDRTRIDRRVSWNLFFQILAGFRHIHAHGLVHRDCKPANILLQSGPGGPSDLEVKVGDFGLAKDLRSGRASAPLIGASDLLIAASTSTPAPTMAGRSAQTQSSSEGSGSLSSSSESYPTTVPMAVPTPNHLGDGAGGGSTSAGHSFSTTSCLRGSTIYGRSAPAGTFSPLLAHVSHTGRIGTKIYTAPEQESKRGEYSSKADVFSLGIVLFELFYIFPTKMERSKVLSDLRAGSLPTGFSESWPLEAKTILWMMSPGPEARPTADELLRTLQSDPDLSTSLHIG